MEENVWGPYDKKCPECGGAMLKKKNRTGAMATVKHAETNPTCSLKMWSVSDGRKKGTERTEEKTDDKKGGKAKAAAAEGGSPATSGPDSGAATGGNKTGGTGTGSNASGDDEEKNSQPAPRESYGDRLKRLYG